jgi:hypothetical protein
MRRWLTIATFLVLPWLNGCCCINWQHGCHKLFCRPCMFGRCGGRGYSVDYGAVAGAPIVAGCPTCSGASPAPIAGPFAAPMSNAPIPAPFTPAPPTQPIEKLTAVPPGATVPTKVIR